MAGFVFTALQILAPSPTCVKVSALVIVILRGNEAMTAVAEGVKVSIFCHFWENEAMGAVAEGVKNHAFLSF